MIQFCTCNKSFTSSLEVSEGEDGSKSCRSCGGARRMWGFVGPEFSRVIDPQLKWKTSSNSKHRALRRARTFTQDNVKKFVVKNTRDIEAIFDKSSKNEGDLLVSESEKFGVSVLGRRFSDNLGSVPIKKRRFSLIHSHSTPHLLSSSDFQDHDQGGSLSLFQNNPVPLQQDEFSIYSSHRVDWDQAKSSGEKRNVNNNDEQVDDSVDFSGISILAAAACYSSIEKGFMDFEGPTIRRLSREENPSSLRFSKPHIDKDLPSKLELGDDEPNPSVVSSIVGETLGSEQDQIKLDELKAENSAGSMQSFPNKRKSGSSRDDRLHWDLNTVMDAWESQQDGLSNSDSSDSSDAKSNGKHGRKPKHGLPQTQAHEALQDEYQLKDAEVIVENAPEKMNHAGIGETSCGVTAKIYPIESNSDLDRDLSAKMAIVYKEEKYETDGESCSKEASTHNTGPCTLISGNALLDRLTNACHPFYVDDAFVRNVDVDSCNDHTGECKKSTAEENNRLRSLCKCLPPDEAVSINAEKSTADKNTSGIVSQVMPVVSCFKCMATEHCLADDEIGNAFSNANQSTVLMNSKETLDNEEHLSINARINQYDAGSADLRVNSGKSCIFSTESLNTSTAVPFLVSPKHTNSISGKLMLNRNGIPSADDVLISRGECVRQTGKDSLEEHFDSELHSNASRLDPVFASGLEKVDFLGDDDSQYEDGELREYVLNSWGDDGAEEAETEHVDYGSDYREADVFEAESDHCSHSDLAVGNVDSKFEEKLASTSNHGDRLPHTEDDSVSKCFLKGFSTKDVSNASFGEEDVRIIQALNTVSEPPDRDEKRLLVSNKPDVLSDVPGKSGKPECSRIKSSGWDKLPGCEDAAFDHFPAATSVNGEYAGRLVVSSAKRVERSKSFDALCRKEALYAMDSRKHDRVDLNAERSTKASRSIGRSRQPIHSYGRGRVDCWMGSPDYHGSCRFDSPGYYSSPNFAPGLRNAAAAAVAKVESNGFVVAPDGTIVKAGSVGSGSHLSGRPLKSSTHLQPSRRGSTMENDVTFGMSSEPSNSTREGSPDRCFNVDRVRTGRYGSGVISLGHRNRYHAQIFDRRIDSPSSQNLSSKRQRSFSPHRRPVHLSHEHTRSPSRSKTRSPHPWASPRGRDDVRISGVSDVRIQSRSPPIYKTPSRMQRQRSPQRRAFPAEELSAYAPSSRSHSSPPHTSRWLQNERILQGHPREGHYQEHQPRGSTGRRSPDRIFSQTNRLNHIDSRGRVKPDEYCQPIYPGRFHECAGYGRGSKHDIRGDGRRGESNRYEIIHPEEHLESNDNMKCIHYGESDTRASNFQPKFSGFQRRKSPKTFDRSVGARCEESPRRFKGEKIHFRHGKLLGGVRDTSDNMPLQRRP